ncbi:glycan-binding surface protein [Dyadobacter tibetensis]|uniref:glycan-binding surface protein n=1 Tax=Dyadobacter tibetensis TaxID=1211851 RepID=UPI000470E6A9|nr:glycan-binding surface protein [Dyadobacter tibetensis]
MINSYKKNGVIGLILMLTVLLGGCSDKDLPNQGEPLIEYIRVSKPESSDSLLIGASQGSLIAIVGQNLQDTREIWFNDQRASLTPTYVSAQSILVRTPSNIPTEINNKMTLVFGNGQRLEHNFKIEISKPVVSAMNSEFVLTGEIATIRGNYFYPPLTVTFAGNVEGEVVSVDDQLMQVRIPEGALPGQIVVKTNFGEAKSDFWFRDNRNIFLSSDPFTGWWNKDFVVSNPGEGDPKAINGNYIRVKKIIPSWAWTEVAGGPPDAMGPISKNIPDEAILSPDKYNLKFEVNTIKPYTANVLKLNIGLSDFNNDQFTWMPPYDTKGEWKTVVIPFEELAAAYEKAGVKMRVNPNGYHTRLLFHGGGELDCDISFDNFRIVPKIIKE